MAPKRRPPRRRESPLVTQILKALALRGVWAWRANSGTQVIKATMRTRRRVIKGAPAGTPDILLVLPKKAFGGFLVPATHPLGAGPSFAALCGIEVKSPDGRQRASQKLWQGKAERHGVRYAVVRSVKEALAVVEGWR